ncbi:syntaxin-binding protein 1-like [Sycon ciliatum]|uniref:syntaxin-binding protein 1-like n=1 Tax=Sycon ciliatum TaxID=27933 RepID=UPI0020ADBDF2|eukprot:scpid62369/ scgid13535/ Syntaxin-binding protein 1; N-Sec1; Protein unc-18 homolog 1; Protein unc-18 homolog A
MSLKNLVAQRIQTDVIDAVTKKGQWAVLVVDHLSMRVISACCKMHEILSRGITLVESIEKSREPLPHLDAIYFISPTEASVTSIVRDFVNDRSEPLYRSAHIFFTEPCSDALFQKLAVPSIARVIRTMKEVNIAFMPAESRVFSLDAPDAFQHFFSPSSSRARSVSLDRLAEQISTVCFTLNEFPAVRYRSESDRTKELADKVQESLDKYKRDVDSNLGQAPGKSKSQLLILDRGFDPVSPVLHELTFQAMTYDLLKIENDVFRYAFTGGSGQTGERECLLDDNDDLWVELRHLHIAEVSQKVSSMLRSFVESKKETKGKSVNMRELSKLIKKMPQYQKELNRYSLHSQLAEDNMVRFRGNVEKLVSIEQDLAMGTDSDGEKVKDPMRLIVPVLLDEKISKLDKIRILLLFIIIKNGISDENLEKLMRHAGIPSAEAATILNMQHLGVKIIEEDGSKKKKRPKRKDRHNDFALSRWTPLVKDMMEDVTEGQLDKDLYPFLRKEAQTAALSGDDSQASSGPISARWKFKPDSHVAAEAKSGPRLIIVVVGGATYSELRAAYEVSKANSTWEVIIGGTELLTPGAFLNNLQQLSDPSTTTQAV